MVKKIKRTVEQAADSVSRKARSTAGGAAAALMDSQMAGAVKDSAQHIWLAGMGAFSKAQEGGNKVFEALVKEGLNLQRKTQGLAEDKINEVTGRMSAMAGTVTAKAGQNWDKLESIFEQRTAKAMNKLGVPTAKDVDALVKRVDELAVAVAQLSKATTAKAASAKATAAKAPARTAAKVPARAPLKASVKAPAKTLAKGSLTAPLAKRTRKPAAA
jgi:poly(hydroxyalkanoate) granule-associated protein